MWIWCGTAIDLVRVTNFINGFLFGVACSKSARNEEPSSRGSSTSRLALVDSALQLNLEIALSGAPATVKPSNRFFRSAESALRRRVT